MFYSYLDGRLEIVLQQQKMCMKKLLTILGLIAQLSATHAQQENMWAFGNTAGVNFNTTPPTAITTGITDGTSFMEASASVCNDKGRLLFYTEGSEVWDSTGTLMPNGSDLPGAAMGYSTTSSTAQGAVIVPMPDSANKYYIFSLQDFNTRGKLFYSVVDMNLNAGRGDIVAGRKGVVIDSLFTERMTAVMGDRCNVWLLVATRANEIKAYEISGAGINLPPVVSAGAGLGSSLGFELMGALAVSPGRTKMAATKMGGISTPTTVALYDFDPATGMVSNEQAVLTDTGSFSACFSPDDSKLYVSTGFMGKMLQYDLSSGNLTTIRGTKTVIGDIGLSHIKLGPDNKIYFFQYGSDPILGSISLPNTAGAACQYTDEAIVLATGTDKGFGLPNAVAVIKRDTVFSSKAIRDCATDSTLLNALVTSGWDYVWNDGSTDTAHKVKEAGTYWVQYRTATCVLHTDTFIIDKIAVDAKIAINGFELSTTLKYKAYQWFLNGDIINGADDSVYTATENGEYTVVVRDENGCTDTSNIYEVTNVSVNGISVIAQQIKIYPNPASETVYIQSPVAVNVSITGIEGKLIQRVTNTRTISLANFADGVYLLHITDDKGTLMKVEKLIKSHR